MQCGITPAARRRSWRNCCTQIRLPLRGGQKICRDAPSDRRSQLLYPTKKAESLRSSKAEIEAAFYEYLTNVLTAEEAAAFAAALNKLYTASKTESRAGFPHFRKAAGGEAAHEKG